MRRGKEIAQGAHASIAFLTRRLSDNKRTVTAFTDAQKEWLDESFTKVTLQVDSKEKLLEVYQKAKEANLEVHLVTDAGRTEFQGVPTETCLAIGPNEESEIDKVTGDLKLY